MPIVNNTIIGLSDFHYALLTADPDGGNPTWGTVYSVPDILQKASWNPGSNSATLFADDKVQNLSESLGDMKLSFGFADMPPDHLARILGHTYANGIITEKTTDTSPYLALGFKAKRSDGSYSYYWYYKGKFTKPSVDHATKEASTKYQGMTLECSLSCLFANDMYKINARSDDTNFVGSATWWSAVVLPTSDLTALSVVASKSTLNAKWTFSKVSALTPFDLDPLFINDKYFICIKEADGTIYPGALTAVSQVVTFVPTTPFGTGKFSFVASGAIQDIFGIALGTSYALELSY
jgi:phi13 family phage major tail protein